MCGWPELDVDLLKRHTVYSNGYSADSPTIQYFWEVLRGLNPSQQASVLRFVWARTRLPTTRGFSRPFTITLLDRVSSLPLAHTCMFQVCSRRCFVLVVLLR